MISLPKFLYKIDFLICHHIRAKTFSLGSQYMPLCAECTGIYSGFLIGMVYQSFTSRKHSRFPPNSVLFTNLGLIFLMIVQAIAAPAYFPVSDTDLFRFLTGLLCGGSVSVLLFPIFNCFIFEKNIDKPAVNNWRNFSLLILILIVFFAMPFIRSPFVFYFLSYVSTSGVVVIYIIINLLLASFVISWKERKKNFISAFLLSFFALCFLLIEIILLKYNPLKLI